MEISSLSTVSAQLVRVATAREAADGEFLRQGTSENAVSTLQRDEPVREETIRANQNSEKTTLVGESSATGVETGAGRPDAIRRDVSGLVDTAGPNELVQRARFADPPLVSVAAAAATTAPQLIADTAETARVSIDRVALEVDPDSRPDDVDRRGATPAGREADVRVFENAYIIPVGFFVTGPPVPPLTTPTDAEPAVAARAYHGVTAGRTFARPNAGQNTPRSQGYQTPHLTLAVAPSVPFTNAAAGGIAFLSMRTVFRQVRNPRAAFQQPSAVSGTFDERA